MANNAAYIKAISNGQEWSDTEKLSLIDQYNEYLITRLRTKWGIHLPTFSEKFSTIKTDSVESALGNIDSSFYRISKDTLQLTRKGWLFSDQVIADLMLLEEDDDQTAS